MRKPTKTNTVLLAVIGVLAIALVARSDSSSAWAQNQPGQPTTETPFNAAEQRRQMIAALNQISARLGTLESKLNAGPLPVKVTEMPPVVIKEPTTKK